MNKERVFFHFRIRSHNVHHPRLPTSFMIVELRFVRVLSLFLSLALSREKRPLKFQP